MKIESIEVKNYRVLRTLKVENLPQVAFFVGASGAGKSTLFDVFRFIKEALNQNLAQAVSRRGGFESLLTSGKRGSIELKLNLRKKNGQRVSYELEVTSRHGVVAASREVVTVYSLKDNKPLNIVDFASGRGRVSAFEDAAEDSNTQPPRDHVLENPSSLAIKGFGQFKEFQTVSELKEFIENWHCSDFQLSSARLSSDPAGSVTLSESGNNLALVLNHLYKNNRECYEGIIQKMRLRIPDLNNIVVSPTNDGRLLISFQYSGTKEFFPARFVPDGTMKMLAHLVLFHHPQPYSLILIENLESYIYGKVLKEVVQDVREAASRCSQVLISTHSQEVFQCAWKGEAFLLKREDGFTDCFPLETR